MRMLRLNLLVCFEAIKGLSSKLCCFELSVCCMYPCWTLDVSIGVWNPYSSLSIYSEHCNGLELHIGGAKICRREGKRRHTNAIHTQIWA